MISYLDPANLTSYALRAEVAMNGAELREIFSAVLPDDRIDAHVTALKVQERQRKLDVKSLVLAMILCGGNHRFGTQAAMLEQYVSNGCPRVTRGAFYSWFTDGMCTLTERLASEACAWVRSRPVHLPGLLAGRTDWRVVDATTVHLPEALREVFPGSGDYAALKLHMEYSLGVENLVDYGIGPARDHDSRHLVIDDRRRGQGLLVDLAYASHAMLDRCEKHDVKYVIRVKHGWEIWFDGRATEAERDAWLGGASLHERFGAEDVSAADEVIDVDVTVGNAWSFRAARLVAFTTPKGRVMFLTNLPRDTHSYAEVGLLYRLRWTVEVANKLCKSAMSVEEIYARTESSARIIVHAAMLAAVLAQAIAHEEHLLRGWADTKRAAFLEEHVAVLGAAETEGLPVYGYLHWSLVDNFEWLDGLEPRFGLLALDRETLGRRPRPSAETFRRLAAAYLARVAEPSAGR